ncbi:hypothetical protein GGU11DRAFT_127332 [Lentinula aff. detonsa]|uniref:Uncharacterized protein n=1 Tax=Lentinula aff. detonsa TaxID=2804958 RepID=A0AA38KXL6_9AGAR|nr:hypothetical protein GGU10DRAFT_347679 [Lentinula aff. detonsa]KAJ3796651.1 hypothetical protein GGU11DRAFT_127332 [Lentinula aff. detonsa]
MIVSTIQNCILLFSVLFGALAMAAPLDPFDVHDTNTLRPRDSEVSWASLSATFIDTEGDQPPTTVNNQAAKNAINQFFKIARPKLVRKKKNFPAIKVKTWEGTPQPRWLVHGGETGRYTQTISVKLPAMPAVGYYAPATYVLSVSWSNKKVSGVLRPDKSDKIIVEVKEDQLVYAARTVSYAVPRLGVIAEGSEASVGRHPPE